MSPAEFIDNPDWASFIQESFEAQRARAIVDHEDCSALDVESTVSHLKTGGTLGMMPRYEQRKGQIVMTEGVTEVFNTRRHLMVEAGTGTGKSLAYLVPSVQWAWLNDTPVVVSTATKNLQDQLVSSDIPRALKTLEGDAARFKVALLKGRSNYLCLRALDDFFSGGYWTMSEGDRQAMPAFIDWLKTTADGDLDSYEGISKDELVCPGEECAGRGCRFYTRCFVYKARKRASQAHLIIVNHSLALTDAANPMTALLPAYGRLVMDEAHNLEKIATEHFSRIFSEPALKLILNRLLRSGTSRKKTSGSGGVLGSMAKQVARGGLPHKEESSNLMRLMAEITSSISALQLASSGIASAVQDLLQDTAADGPARYRASMCQTPDIKKAHARFEDCVTSLINLLHGLSESILALDDEWRVRFAEYSRQLENIAGSLTEFANDTAFVLAADKPESYVYWIERVRPRKRKAYVLLSAAPLSVADDLRQLVYTQKDSVVLCSATLRTGGNFSYMMRRLGFFDEDHEEAVRYTTLVAESPFDYFRQSLVLAPDFLPDPSQNTALYIEKFSILVEKSVIAAKGRTLVLFTSREMMNSVASIVADAFAKSGIRLLVQGEGLSRELMTMEMRKAKDPTVLFGTQSFWEGVDVAGEALVLVIMARLPFAQKGDPIVEARGEKVAREGADAFRHYLLPEAAIRFRQGFGRLIRTKSDKGVVIVADPRIVTKNYGSSFRKSIPTGVRTLSSMNELIDAETDFLV